MGLLARGSARRCGDAQVWCPARGGARHVAVMGHELCIIYAAAQRTTGGRRGQSLEREFRWCESVVDGAQQAQRRGDGER